MIRSCTSSDWPGYKSGALNYALGECRPARRDHRRRRLGLPDRAGLPAPLRPALRRRAGRLRADAAGLPRLGVAAYLRRLYYSYKYFFAVSQPSRNERDGAIFAGTMGLIRRRR